MNLLDAFDQALAQVEDAMLPKTTWTPGPCTVGNANAPIPSAIAVVTDKGLRIADVHVWATMIGDDKWANARLIAAAPEMYQALCALLEPGNPAFADIQRANARALLARIDGGA